MSGRACAALALAALALAAPPASAREVPPPPGEPRPFALPAKQDFRLANGLNVTLVPFGTVPKATILVTVRTGNIADGPQTGLADLVAALLKEGAGPRAAPAIARAAAEMGGALEVSAGPDETSVVLDVLAERTTDAIALAADVLRRPHLPASELPRLKADLARQAAIERSQPQAIAGEAFAQLLYDDSVYGRTIPSAAQIASMTIDDVRRFYAAEFGAARTRVYVAGRFDLGAVEAAIRAAFGDWAPGPPPRREVPPAARTHVVRLIDRPGAAQSTVLLGLPVPAPATPGFMRLSVANALLGGSLLSRLEQNLREDKGYTYGVSSRLTPYVGATSWALATDINSADTAAGLVEIFREIERLRSEPPSADELRRTQNYRAGTFVLGASSRAGLLAQLDFLAQQDLSDDWLTHYVARLYEVTPADVREATAAALDPAAMTLVVVGDLAKIRDGVLAVPALKGADLR